MQVKLNDAKSRYGDEAEPKIFNTAQSLFDDKQIHPQFKHKLRMVESSEGESPPRAADGTFKPARIRRPAPPPTELNGNSSPPGDERDRAAASGNVRAFFSEGNRRDFAKWKGQS